MALGTKRPLGTYKRVSRQKSKRLTEALISNLVKAVGTISIGL
jgi:hypothetical protein